MNHLYRLIWNKAKQCLMVASELTKSHGKTSSSAGKRSTSPALTRLSALLLSAGLGMAASPAMAIEQWIGTSGDWTTTSNWSGGSVPGSSSNVLIDNGGTVTLTSTAALGGYLILGSGDGSGSLIIGSGGDLALDQYLHVGRDGLGSLTIQDGGNLSYLTGTIGASRDGVGAVTVTGSDSALQVLNVLRVGMAGGTGTLTITEGGSVSARSSDIGYDYGGLSSTTDTVIVDGNGSEFNMGTGSLTVGAYSAALLTIRNGGDVISGSGNIGNESGSNGTVILDGAGSTWTDSGQLQVGVSGEGTLEINNGSSVTSTHAFIGIDEKGTVKVDGVNSSWAVDGQLTIGNRNIGSLTLSNTGSVNVEAGAGIVFIAQSASATGTLNIGAAIGETAIAAGTLTASAINFGEGTGSLVFNHTDSAYDFATTIRGAGAIGLYSGITHFTGSLTGEALTGTDPDFGPYTIPGFSGTTTVDGGTLLIADGEELILGGDYSQTTAGMLKLGVSSGTSFGQLNVGGIANFAAGSKIEMNVTAVNTLANGNTLSAAISAGTLNATTFSVTDNSALFDFTATVNGNQVDLNTGAAGTGGGSGIATTVLSSVQHNKLPAAVGAATVLDSFVAGGTTHTDIDNVVTALGQLATEAEVAQAVAETLPIFVGGTRQVASSTMHSINRVIQARQSGFNGLSSGDDFLTDRHLWLKLVGNWSEQDKRNNVSGFDANSYGFIAGMDSEINDYTRIGFALSYMNTDVEGKGSASGSSADIDAYQAIFYGSHAVDSMPNVEFNWQADLGVNKNKGRRDIRFINRVAKADYDSYTAHIGVGAGHAFELSNVTTIIPSIRADYSYIRDESYTETGANSLNLNVDGEHYDELIVMAEGHLSHVLNEKATFIANVGLGYDLLNDSASLAASYSGGGTAFTTEGIDPSPWLVRSGVGISYVSGDTSMITASYALEGRSDFLSQTASVKFRWLF